VERRAGAARVEVERRVEAATAKVEAAKVVAARVEVERRVEAATARVVAARVEAARVVAAAGNDMRNNNHNCWMETDTMDPVHTCHRDSM
jgi:hypothetical protein